ncbi:MAG: coenzyme F420-0:L-glutamate ligase [Elusimicrobiota bacterium]|nr:coenzyme F420-0:L-glutamate ligase [Elusimicrobiota bacterium]
MTAETLFQPNTDKKLECTAGGRRYIRIPVKTRLINKNDDIVETAVSYLKDKVQAGDIVFISEKVVAITQGRALLIKNVKPRRLAFFLSRFVTRTPAGIGLGMPETMEMALRDCGVMRILFAAGVGGFTKVILKRKGDFYRIAGPRARAIDGPTAGTVPPYNKYVVLGPENPGKVAGQISDALAEVSAPVKAVISDINDLGGNILGVSHKGMNITEILQILKDNPLGQGHQKTPMGIIRKK